MTCNNCLVNFASCARIIIAKVLPATRARELIDVHVFRGTLRNQCF